MTDNQPALVGSVNLGDGGGNIVHDNAGTGIRLGGGYNAGSIIAGNVVYNQNNSFQAGINASENLDRVTLNIVHDNYQGIVALADGELIDRNRVYGNLHVGIAVGWSSEVRGNTVYANDVGIQTGGSQGGVWFGSGFDGLIDNNTVRDNARFGIVLDGTTQGYAASGTPPHATLRSNTIRQDAGTAVAVQGSSVYVEIRNNILDLGAGTVGISVAADSQVGFLSDYNLFHAPAARVGLWQSTDRTTLAQWRNATYGDAHSLTGDPGFVDAAGGHLHVQSAYGSNHGGSLAPILASPTGLPAANPGTWADDASTSIAIDRGDPTLPFADEPAPNGQYANLGAESNTPLASLSPADYVLVTSPGGGAVWPEGQTYDVEWRTQDAAGTVTIDLLRHDNPTPVRTLAAGAPNTGRFAWTLSADLAPADDYVIRVTRNEPGGASGTSTGVFTVAPVTHLYYVNDGAAAAGDWTSSAGDDANDGLDPAHPKASVRGVLLAYHLGGGDTIRVDAGTYGLTTNIFLDPSADGITIEGYHDLAHADRAAVLDRQNAGTDSYVFEMTGASHVTLDHLTMTGALMAVYSDYASSVDYLTVSHSDVHGNASAGIYLNSASHANIVGNAFHQELGETQTWNLRVNGNDNTIEGNTVTGRDSWGSLGIDVSGARLSVLGNEVSHVDTGLQVAIAASATGASLVSGNRVHDSGSGISGSSAGNATISNNEVWSISQSESRAGISFSGVAGTVVADNVVHGNYDGLSIFGTAIVRGNTAYGNAGAGIRTSDSATVQGNTVYANGTGIAGGGRILNNTVRNNTVQGILVQSNGGRVLNNTIYQPLGIGIAVQASGNVDIRFDYGSGNTGLSPTVGISAGDGVHALLAPVDAQATLTNAHSILYSLAPNGWTELGAYEFTGNSADTTPTVVTAVTPSRILTGGTLHLSPTVITVGFNHALSAVDAALSGLYDLRGPGADGIYNTPDDVVFSLLPRPYAADATQETLDVIGGPLPQGDYRFTIFATLPRALHDAGGRILDGDQNGSPGGDFTRDFVMGVPDIAVPDGTSTLAFWTYRFTWGAPGDSQDVRILDAGGNVLAVVSSGQFSDTGWTRTAFDMSPYAGQTVQVRFSVHLNGDAQPSGMFLDDVSLRRTDKSGDGLGQALVALPGDANLDGQVSLLDYNIVKVNFGNVYPAGENHWADGDVNGDGQVSLLDYNVVKVHFGEVAPPSPLTSGADVPAGPAPSDAAALVASPMDASTVTPIVAEAVDAVIYTIVGDANLDGQVGLLDWDVIKANFGSTTAPWTMGDVNGDGQVNLLDYNIVKTHFGQTATVPEAPAIAAWTGTPTVTGAVAEREKIDAAGLVLEPNLSVVDWSAIPSTAVAALWNRPPPKYRI